MKINRIIPHCILAIFSVILLQSCEDNDSTDDNFRYLPQEIDTNSSSSNLNLLYTYDASNRIAQIRSTYTVDTLASIKYIRTNFSYDSEGQVSKTESNVYSISALSKDTTYLYSITNTFTYSQLSVLVNSMDNNKTTTTTIELDNKMQAVKKSESENKYTTYQYSSLGNLKKSIDQDSLVSEFSYDARRGVYREVNLPPWYLNIFMDNSADATMINTGEFRNIRHNCVSIKTIERNDSTTVEKVVNTFSNIYGGFGYPTSITDQNNTKSIIRYIGIK